MIRQILIFMFFSLSLPLVVESQEAFRYFPLVQGNTWIYYHKHIVHEGIAIKPAAITNEVVTADTLIMRVNGTITEQGKTYAVLELDNKMWGYYRVEGNYLHKYYTGGGMPVGEGKLVDFTHSDVDHYEMKDVVSLPTYRDVETRTLPCGIMTGYGCEIERSFDSLHESKYMFFVDSIGPAFFSSLDGWKNPPVSDGYFLMSYNVKLDPSSVGEIQVYKSFVLQTATPNPFNPETTISFSLSSPGITELAVYSASGQQIRTLISGAQKAGTHSVVWDGRDDTGKPVSSGVYLSRLIVGKYFATGKMLLLR
jgi:hypothetical protein